MVAAVAERLEVAMSNFWVNTEVFAKMIASAVG
jgi:hypothetical protein